MRIFGAPGRSCFVLLTAGGLIALASCGTDDTFGKRYPVSGTVTYNGKPLEKGRIGFFPDDPKGVGAAGDIENGSYTLSTGGGGDGAVPASTRSPLPPRRTRPTRPRPSLTRSQREETITESRRSS